MPSVVGVVKVVSNSGSLVTGDTLIIAPTSTSKSYSGAGSGLTGDFSAATSIFSATVTSDQDLIEAEANKAATGT